MATMKQSVGSLTAFSSDDNLNSLANNDAKPLGEVDNATNYYPSAKLKFIFNLAASGLGQGGTIEIYLITCLASEDTAANWDDGIDPDDTGDVYDSIFNARLIKVLKADNNMNNIDVTWNCNDLAGWIDESGKMIGDLPPYWAIIVANKTGQAFPAAGHTASYMTLTYTA